MSAPPLSEGTKTATLTEVNRGIVQVASLAAGHSLSQVERARRLSAESEALRRQAEQQVQRARNNLGLAGASDGRR